jgi:hypothetical protein
MARYKNIPDDLVETYRLAMTDPDRLSQHAELALVTARIDDLLATLNKSSSLEDIPLIVKANNDLKKAWHLGDNSLLEMAMYDLDQRINSVATQEGAWGEIIRLVEMRRKLVDNERKYMVQLGQLVPLQDVIHLMQEIANVVVRYVTDDNAKRQILTQMELLLLPSKSQTNALGSGMVDNR